MQSHKIVWREEWIEARKPHMVCEKKFTRARGTGLPRSEIPRWLRSLARRFRAQRLQQADGAFDRYSAQGSDFNFDFAVSFTPDARAP